jgi:ferrous-iron efflux pump FieF
MHKTGFFHNKAQNAAFFAAISAACLVVGKLGFFFFTGSLVVALSTWDSVMDVIVSLANRQVIQFARIDADHNHPYGHGRAESIAALAQGCIITGGAVAIIISSVKQLSHFFNTNEFPKITTNWFLFLLLLLVLLSLFCLKKREKCSTALLCLPMHSTTKSTTSQIYARDFPLPL